MMITYTKEKLNEVVNKSQNLHQVLIEFGRNPSGGSYRTLHRKLKEWDINYEHFLTPSEVIKKNYSEGKLFKKDKLYIFVENSKVSRATVRRRIITDSLKEYKCVNCNNEGEWMGKKITLILDHINGINNDHRLDNLRFLCPNCNATLKTHCKGYMGLIDKPKKIDGRTIKRDRTNTRKIKNRPSKNELSKMIIETSYSAVGRKYGVSDNTIRKWAKNYGII